MVVVARQSVHMLAVHHKAAQPCTVPVSEEEGTTTFRKNRARESMALRADSGVQRQPDGTTADGMDGTVKAVIAEIR
jgi:hypothetical protein